MIENIKNQSELKSTVTEMKNTLKGVNRLKNVEKLISNLKDRIMESNQTKQYKEKRIFKKERLRGAVFII